MCPPCTQSVPWGVWGGLLPLGWASSTSLFSRNQQGSGTQCVSGGAALLQKSIRAPRTTVGSRGGFGEQQVPCSRILWQSLPASPALRPPSSSTHSGDLSCSTSGRPRASLPFRPHLVPMSLMSCLGCRFALIRSASESSAEPEPFSLSFN